MAPQLCLFYVPGQPSKKTLFEKPWSDGEEITTGKTGTTFCIRSGHKINWFLAFEALPVFPVVIFRHISRDKGQKAGPHLGPSRLYRDSCETRQNPGIFGAKRSLELARITVQSTIAIIGLGLCRGTLPIIGLSLCRESLPIIR